MESSSLPETPRLDVVETLNGVAFADPYRWLESESPEAQAWERGRSGSAGRRLQGMPGFDALVGAVERALSEAGVMAPKRRGGRWFAVGHDETAGEAVLTVADEPGGRGRAIVAPARLASAPDGGCDWFHPSPDGRRVALGVSVEGDEQSVMHILDVADGSPLSEPIPFAGGGRVAWLPDSSGLYYGAGLARDPENSIRQIFLWEEGRPRPLVPLALPRRTPERFLAPQLSECGRWLAVVGSSICPRVVHVLDRERDRWHNPFPDDRDLRFSGIFAGGRYLAVTTEGAPRGRLVAAPPDRLDDRSAWVELVPQSDEAVLRSVALCGERLVLSEYVGGVSRLRIATLDGEIVGEVPLPEDGVVTASGLFGFHVGGDAPFDVGEGELTFVFSAIATPPAAYRYELASGLLERLGPEGPPPLEVEVVRGSCESDDGHEVPYVLVAPAGADLRQPRPTVISAYGGWNVVFLADLYLGILAPIVAAGGAVVVAHLRGDATYGADQWQDGKLANKQKSFDDLYGLAEHLIDTGVTSAAQLGLFGSSNGGLLGAVAATQAPELFGAIVSAVPLIDMSRFQIEAFSEMFAEEYGDPYDPAHTRLLRDYSPYHNVPARRRLPAMLFVAGGSDIRCQPWHARKMTAALEAAQSGDQPILLRVHPRQGHATTIAGPPTVIAEWIGFLMDRTGLSLAASESRRKEMQDAG